MNTRHPFSHCPSCGAADLTFDGMNRFSCSRCGFVFFHNTAAACGAILQVSETPLLEAADRLAAPVLLLLRGTEPQKGYLDYPGGFVDPGESAEEALERELQEEIGLKARELRYFVSAPNRYNYRGVVYNTCDLVFTGRIVSPPESLQAHEVAGYRLVDPQKMPLDSLAFPSLRWAMERFVADLI